MKHEVALASLYKLIGICIYITKLVVNQYTETGFKLYIYTDSESAQQFIFIFHFCNHFKIIIGPRNPNSIILTQEIRLLAFLIMTQAIQITKEDGFRVKWSN
jgi:hypothetical protein